MKLLALVAPLAALLLSAPALADPSKSELAAASAAEVRGAEIYAYDQAAWHSTDQLHDDMGMAHLSLETLLARGFAGFIVEPAADGLLLATYYGKKDGKTFAIARYWMAGSAVKRGGLVSASDDSALSPLALKLVERRDQALAIAQADDVGICTDARPNTVVLPPRADGSIPVYLMSAMVKNGSFPGGGHYLYVFDPAGKLVSKRPFAKSCVMVEWDNVPKGADGVGFTYLLDPQPNEIHVFISLNMPIPLAVLTSSNRELWWVDHGRITYKQTLDKEP